MASFSAATDQWIPVAKPPRENRLASIIDILDDTEYYLASSNPLVNVSVHRMLCALVYHVLGNPSEEEYQRRIVDTTGAWLAPVRAWVEENKDRFDLYDPDRPYLQDPSLEGEKIVPAAELDRDISHKRPLLDNHVDTDTRGPLTHAEALQWLWANACYSSGGKHSGCSTAMSSSPLVATIAYQPAAPIHVALAWSVIPTRHDMGGLWLSYEPRDTIGVKKEDGKVKQCVPVAGVVEALHWLPRRWRLIPSPTDPGMVAGLQQAEGWTMAPQRCDCTLGKGEVCVEETHFFDAAPGRHMLLRNPKDPVKQYAPFATGNPIKRDEKYMKANAQAGNVVALAEHIRTHADQWCLAGRITAAGNADVPPVMVVGMQYDNSLWKDRWQKTIHPSLLTGEEDAVDPLRPVFEGTATHVPEQKTYHWPTVTVPVTFAPSTSAGGDLFVSTDAPTPREYAPYKHLTAALKLLRNDADLAQAYSSGLNTVPLPDVFTPEEWTLPARWWTAVVATWYEHTDAWLDQHDLPLPLALRRSSRDRDNNEHHSEPKELIRAITASSLSGLRIPLTDASAWLASRHCGFALAQLWDDLHRWDADILLRRTWRDRFFATSNNNDKKE